MLLFMVWIAVNAVLLVLIISLQKVPKNLNPDIY